jgi:hypothetical protein
MEQGVEKIDDLIQGDISSSQSPFILFSFKNRRLTSKSV